MSVRLKSLDSETLEAPKSRIGSAANAKHLVQSLISDDDKRSKRRSKMQGLMDGNPPFSPATLKDKGMADCPNFNLRTGEGILESAKTPYYDLVFEVSRFANITLNFGHIDAELNTEWSEGISDEYHETLDRWKGFDAVIQLHQWKLCFNGIGPIFWRHPLDWRGEANPHVLVPVNTKADVTKLPVVVILHRFRVDYLMQCIRNEKSAEARGWNPKLVKKEIAKTDKVGTSKGHGSEAERYQKALRHGDLYYALSQTEDVRVASLFVPSISDGKVSHYIIGRNPPTEDEEKEEWSDEKEEGYLFKSHDIYEDFSQVICPFFFDTGPDGEWHGVKGLGPKIYDICDVENRMTMHLIRGAMIRSGVVLETVNNDVLQMQDSQIQLIGGSTIINSGFKAANLGGSDALQGAMIIKSDLRNTLETNTGSQRIGEETSAAPTLGQEQMRAQIKSTLTKGAVNRYYNSLDPFHFETLRRLLNPKLTARDPGGKEADDFRQRCVAHGIPEEALKIENVLRVKAVRSVGYGSPQIRDMATKELLSLTPAMDEVSKRNAFRARAAAIPGIGQANVDMYFPSLRKQRVAEDHVWDAMMENIFLRQLNAETPPVTSRQNHEVHFGLHFKDATHHLEQMKAGQAQAHDVLVHLEQAGPHMKEHLDKMPRADIVAALASGKRPQKQSNDHKQMEQGWQKLSQVADKLHKDVNESNAQANGQQAKSPQLDPEMMKDLSKIHGDLAIKREKMQGAHALKAQDQAFKHRLKDLDLAAKIRRESRQSLITR